MHGWTDLLDAWSLGDLEVRTSYNVAPTSSIAGLLVEQGQITAARAMRWGMIPPWSNSFSSTYATFNARCETVSDKPTFRHAWKNAQRCIIPMAGYYEWRTVSQIGGKQSKQPLYISDVNQGVLLAAGLFEPWGRAGDVSCTILTKPASEELSTLHPRMPILLDSTTLERWISDPNERLNSWLIDAPHPHILYWPVSPAVGHVKNDSIELIKPLDTHTAT